MRSSHLRKRVIKSENLKFLEVVVMPVSRDMVFALWYNVVVTLRWKFLIQVLLVNCYYSDGRSFYFVSVEEMLLVGGY